jgi:putative DNA primase/helicase
MTHPIVFNDIMAASTRADGSVTYNFDRTKAAKSILAKMDLAVEVFDSKEDKPEIWYYEDGYWHPGGVQLIAYYLDEVAENESDSENINDVLRRVRGKLRLQPVEFDITNPYLVGCKDGVTLDLRTRTARKAAPTDYISMPIPVKYDPDAKCPEFIKFLEEITATDDDRLSIIDFLASLLITEPMDFFVAAPGLGSNGRSKLKDFIRAFIGSDACRSIPLKNLSDRFTAGFLTRCRVNFCNETEINGIILEFIKRSSEKMPVEQKFKGMVNALLYLKYFFDTNTMPAISDTSYGAERRLCRWDMPWRFVDNPSDSEPMEKLRDPDIIAKITTPEELSGVLNLVLERASEVIRQRMIHHRDGGLQEYALQSRSGDIFIDLFLQATNNESDRVHSDTIRTAYQRYCTVTNSSLLNSKALKTLIESKLARLQMNNLKIDNTNRRGYEGLKLDKELFDGIITTLENARKENKPIFQTLLMAFPDLQNTTNTTIHYQTTTTETIISNLFGSFVVKYGKEEEKRNGNLKFPRGNQQSKTTTSTTSLPIKPTDTGLCGSDLVVDSSDKVVEFLRDGGQSSLKRFLSEFPEART